MKGEEVWRECCELSSVEVRFLEQKNVEGRLSLRCEVVTLGCCAASTVELVKSQPLDVGDAEGALCRMLDAGVCLACVYSSLWCHCCRVCKGARLGSIELTETVARFYTQVAAVSC